MTLHRRLLLLIAVTAVPLLAFAAGLVLWQSRTQQEVSAEQATRVANTAMQGVDRALSGAIASLQVLAASPALSGGDFASFHAQARAAAGIAANTGVTLFDRSGRRLVSTRVPYGAPLEVRQDMSVIGAPFDTGQPTVTRLFISHTAGKPTVAISVPVVVHAQVPYVLAAGMLADHVSELLNASGLPPDWVAAVLDQHGTIIARTRSPEVFVGQPARPEVWEALRGDERRIGIIEGTTKEGAGATLSFARSSLSGWTTVVAVPRDAFAARRREQLMLLSVLALAVLACAGTLAWQVSRRIRVAADRLDAMALQLQHSRPLPQEPIGILQFDQVADTMRHAGTQLLEREESLRQSLADLRSAHGRLQAEEANKDRFIATLAHELRNPLAPIRTGLHVLARAPAPEIATKMIATMERQLTHMVRLIDDLLDISRISRGKLVLQQQPVALQKVIAFAVEATEASLRSAGLALLQDIPPEPLWVQGDYHRLGQVVVNLLDNAAKFTPAGGSVRLAARAVGEQIELRIEDTGPGIRSERLESVFDMFSHVKDEHAPGKPGLGIGLPLARRLVQMHGGTLRASPAPAGRGTVMLMLLPRSVQASEPAPQPARPAADAPLRVLVVDDNAEAADVMTEGLRLAGHDVRTAYSGEAALQVCASFTADVALLDIGMPGMNGYELCRRLRGMATYESCRIVAVTGWAGEGDRAKSRTAGFDEHLAKPAGWTDIQQVLANAAGSKRAVTSRMPA